MPADSIERLTEGDTLFLIGEPRFRFFMGLRLRELFILPPAAVGLSRVARFVNGQRLKN